MDRVRLWLLRRSVLAVIGRRREFLEVERAWWAALGVRFDPWDPSGYELFRDLVDHQHREHSIPWQQQVDVLTLLDEIRIVGGPFRAADLFEEVSHPSDEAVSA